MIAAARGPGAARRWLWGQALQSFPALLLWRWRRAVSPVVPNANAYRPGGRMLRNWMADAAYAARRLRARPGYVAVTLLTLALGIGGTAAVYGIARTLLFEPLPYAREQEIATFYMHGAWTEEEFLYLRGLFPGAALPGFQRVGMFRPADVTMREGDAPTRLFPGSQVSAELFDVLGTQPFIGRSFREGDDRQGSEAVAIISYGLWRELGADKGIIGHRLTLNGVPRTIVGVMPRGFWFPSPDVRLWVAQPLDPQGRNGSYTLVGRAAPGADVHAMAPSLARLTTILGERFKYPEQWDKTRNASVTPIREDFLGSMRPALVATFVSMALILLIACANVAALMLGQVESRETELAVRSALGANRRRLTQQLVVEGLLLGLGSAIAGSVLAAGGFRLVARALPIGAWGDSAAFDWRMFAAALALAIGAVLLIVVIPASSLWRGDLRGALSSLRTGGIQGRGGRLERGLVVAEVALAMLIASGAALLVRSVTKLYAIDPGVQTQGVAVIDVAWEQDVTSAQRRAAMQALISAFQTLPGARSVAASLKLPLRGPGNSFGITVPGHTGGTQETTTYFRVATPDYFRTMGMKVREGRDFDISDRPDTAEITTVINEALAKKYFPGESPIGKYVENGFRPRQRIVGIVNDVAEANLTDATEPTRYYVSQQVPWWGTSASFVIRTDNERAAQALLDEARRTVNRVTPTFAVQQTTTMSRIFDRSVGAARQIMSLLALLSGLALLLGAVGIYGVMAHFAARRKRDWAIRLALGLPSWRVVTQIVREGGILIVSGVALGAMGTVVMSRLLASFLFGVSRLDPLAFVGASAILMVTGLLAAYLPARRAGSTAPAMVLREQ